jgi:hypothetical protein
MNNEQLENQKTQQQQTEEIELRALEKQIIALWIAIFCGNTLDQERLTKIISTSNPVVTNNPYGYQNGLRLKALLSLIAFIKMLSPMINFLPIYLEGNQKESDELTEHKSPLRKSRPF